MALAHYWDRQQGHSVTGTTTRQERVAELEELSRHVSDEARHAMWA